MLTGELNQELFDRFRRLVLKLSGVSLAESKQGFLKTRLRQRIHECGCAGFEQYFKLLASGEDRLELKHFLDAVTTHHTFFFREAIHFEHFAHYVESGLARGENRYRVWSAACSTGEEPYSLLISLLEHLGDIGFERLDLRVLATDIAVPTLAKAAAGVYSTDQLRGLSDERLSKHFRPHDVEDHRQVNASLRERVTYRELNLLDKPYPMKGPFDAIFCRNVLIYFQKETQIEVLRRMSSLLAPGGLLFVGLTETAMHAELGLEFVGPAVYRRQHNCAASPVAV